MMKSIHTIIFTIALFFVHTWAMAQNIEQWHKLDSQQRKDILDKLSPAERMELFRNAILQEVVKKMNLPQDKIHDFTEIYSEYQLKIHAVKEAYPMQEKLDELTEEEAKKILNNSFIVSEKLLEIRKEYAKKFQTIISTHKVIELFHYEGRIRKRIMERKIKYNDADKNNKNMKP